jgi:hypothetical protein
VTSTAISAVVPRKRTILVGQVTEVASFVRPWARFEAELCDGTGTITLRFMGRTEIPGLVLGSRLSVDGTPSIEGDILVMLNPLYEIQV